MTPGINVTLNGSTVAARPGMTILELARENGVHIPTLCYHADLGPIGACRVCVVEVASSRTLVASCHTPLAPNMVIETHSPKVIQARRVVVELLLAGHPDSCLVCDKANICELRALAADLGVGVPKIKTRKHYFPIEDDNPYVVRDLSKCVLCYRCVKACNEIKQEKVYNIGYRGQASKIIVDLDGPLDKEVCRSCDVCVSRCPVGALVRREARFQKKVGKPLIIRESVSSPG